jgi:hypothetical protein
MGSEEVKGKENDGDGAAVGGAVRHVARRCEM